MPATTCPPLTAQYEAQEGGRADLHLAANLRIIGGRAHGLPLWLQPGPTGGSQAVEPDEVVS